MSINPTDLTRQKPRQISDSKKNSDSEPEDDRDIITQGYVAKRIAELEEKIRNNELNLKNPLPPAEKKRIENEKKRLEKQLEMIKDLFREDSACERVSGCTVALRL